MSSTGRNWLIGCGVGCGLLLIATVALLATGAFFVKDMVQEFEVASDVSDELDRRFGSVRDYCPPAAAVIEPGRVEVFLAVRERLQVPRGEMEDALGKLSRMETDGPDSAGEVFGAVKAGFGLLPRLARYFTVRNQALLDEGMGKGEYLYLYNVIYYGWLEKSPEDGPPFVLSSDAEDGRDEMEEWEIREQRADRIRRRGRDDLLPMLRCQLEALDNRENADSAWRRALEEELQAVEEGTLRIPWIHGVPDAAATALEPFRSRLEDSYSELCSPLEAGGS